MLIPKSHFESFCSFIASAFGTIVTIHEKDTDDELARFMLGGRIFVIVKDRDGAEVVHLVSGDKNMVEKISDTWETNLMMNMEEHDANG